MFCCRTRAPSPMSRPRLPRTTTVDLRRSWIRHSPSTSPTVHDYFLDDTCTTASMTSSTTLNMHGACISTVAEDPCTTTSTIVGGTTTSTMSTITHIQLHRYDSIRFEDAGFEGITNETTNHVPNALLYERRVVRVVDAMLVACCPSFVVPPTHENPVMVSPHHSWHDTHTLPIRWHQYLIELSGPKHCRGIVSVLPPWFPFVRHGDTCFISFLPVFS